MHARLTGQRQSPNVRRRWEPQAIGWSRTIIKNCSVHDRLDIRNEESDHHHHEQHRNFHGKSKSPITLRNTHTAVVTSIGNYG